MALPNKKDETLHHRTPPTVSPIVLSETERIERTRKFKAMMKKWMADESGHDEAVWPELKESIERNRMSDRSRFSE